MFACRWPASVLAGHLTGSGRWRGLALAHGGALHGNALHGAGDRPADPDLRGPCPQVHHTFNKMGLACLDPKWAGGRSRWVTTDDEDFIVETAKARFEKLGRPFSH